VLTGHTRCTTTTDAKSSTFGDHGIQSFANLSEVMDNIEVTSQIDEGIELLKVTEKDVKESPINQTKGEMLV